MNAPASRAAAPPARPRSGRSVAGVRGRARGPGFTLVELMVATAVSAVVLAGVLAFASAQHQAYQNGRRVRERQANARFALDTLGRAVRQAGYGIDPQFAFDFDFYRCAGASYANDRCQEARRDAADAPDELVLYARDLNYQIGSDGLPLLGHAWRVVAASAEALRLDLREQDAIPRGQILQVICPGASTYAYVTAAGGEAGPGQIPLEPGSDASPFLQNQVFEAAASAHCFNGGRAIAFLIQRQRYFVASDTQFGAPGPLPRTYLMLDTGTDRNFDGEIDEKDLVPIAADISDLQVAYVLANAALSAPPAATDADGNAVWGDTSEAAEQLSGLVASVAGRIGRPCTNVTEHLQDEQSFGTYADPCLFDKGDEDPYRQLEIPGNVRALRLSLIARTRVPAEGGGETLRLAPLENRPGFDLLSDMPDGYVDLFPPGEARTTYRYEVLQATVSAPNLASNGLFTF